MRPGDYGTLEQIGHTIGSFDRWRSGMAKGKHATALFEVIHSGKNSQKSLLSTPRWWFKKRDEEQAAAKAAAAAAAAKKSREPVSAPTTAPSSATSHDENDPTVGRDAVDHQIR